MTYKIELWNMENEHCYLATNDEGKVIEFTFEQHDDATEKAKVIVHELNKYGEWMYFVTTTPSRHAVPLK